MEEYKTPNWGDLIIAIYVCIGLCCFKMSYITIYIKIIVEYMLFEK